MNKEKAMMIAGLVVAFGVGLAAGGLIFSGKQETEWGRAYVVSEVVGTYVKSPQGEEYGKIEDVVIDTNGRVPLTVVGSGGKSVAVPFGAMKYDKEGKYLVLDLGRERYDSLPSFSKESLAQREWVEETYKLFGQAPYWSEEEVAEDIEPMSPFYGP